VKFCSFGKGRPRGARIHISTYNWGSRGGLRIVTSAIHSTPPGRSIVLPSLASPGGSGTVPKGFENRSYFQSHLGTHKKSLGTSFWSQNGLPQASSRDVVFSLQFRHSLFVKSGPMFVWGKSCAGQFRPIIYRVELGSACADKAANRAQICIKQ